jgi:4-hydroxy-4-methyl-2-oxoglutarate aldolase
MVCRCPEWVKVNDRIRASEPLFCPNGWTQSSGLLLMNGFPVTLFDMPATNSHPLRSAATPKDVELFTYVEASLYTAVIADSLDELGYHNQAMNEYVRPLFPECRFAGWARTMSCVDVFHVPNDTYAKEIEAVDSILSGEVVVVSTASSKRNAPWGELLSTAARARGARGAIVDGLVRDVKKIEELGFPVFASGIKPVDSRGRGIVIDCNVRVDCGGVLVSPGDLVFADYDGVIVIPAEVLPDAIRLATEKATRENHTREELLQGAYLRDVYDKYGVL